MRARDSQPDHSRIARGRWGERRAATEYRRLGHVVLDRNWRCAIGEIDLVVEVGDLIVICEVKTRSSDRYGPAAAAVDVRKQRRLRRLGLAWLEAHPVHRGRRLRFDVVAVVGTRVQVFEAAF